MKVARLCVSISFFPVSLFVSVQVGHAQSLDQLRSLNSALARTAGSGDRQAVNRLVRDRANALHSLIQKSPAAVLDLGLTTETRAALLQRGGLSPEDLDSAGQWEGSAQEFVADDFENHRSRSYFRFVEAGRESELYFAGTPPSGTCAQRMSIKGLRVRDRIAVESFTLSAAASPSCSTLGVQRTIAVLVSMPNHPLNSQITAAYVQQAFFGASGRSLTNFWSEASYGQTSATGTVIGPIALPKDYTCDSIVGNQFVEDVIHAVGSSADFSQYQRIFNIVPPLGCGWAGLGGIGCGSLVADNNITFQASGSLISANDPYNDDLVRVLSHEGGHNLGLGHAASVDYGAIPLGVPGDAGIWTEYGDPFDVMGTSLGQYSAPHKQILNWLSTNSNIVNVTADGSFTILPMETPVSGIQALRVQRGSANRWLWLEYRQPLGLFDNSFVNGYLSNPNSNVYSGALIHYEDSSDTQHYGYSKLLDFTAGSMPNDFAKAALTSPGLWADPYSNLTLRVTGASSSGLNVSVSYDGSVFANPSSASFAWYEGGSGAPPAQNITLTSTGRAYSYSATASSPGNWLGVSQSSGSVPGDLQILVNPAGLYAGSYNGTVTLTIPGAPDSPVLIPVTLKVTPNVGSPSVLSISPASGTGAGHAFTAVFSDPVSFANLQFADILFGNPNSAASICHIRYDTASGSFELRSDDGTSWTGHLTPGSTGSVENSQCIVSGIGSSASGSGTLLTINIAVSFKLNFTGTQAISGITQNSAYPTGSQSLGTWTVDSNPTAVSAQPASGVGLRQTFSFLFTDPKGVADISWVGAKFTATPLSDVNGCAFYAYGPYGNGGFLGLWDDADQNVNWLLLGSNSSVTNSTCTIYGASSFASQSGNNVILSVDIGFSASSLRTLPLYMTGGGKTQGIQQIQAGSWEISPSPLTFVSIQTNPPGLQFSIDGGSTQAAPMNLDLAPGPHTLTVAATQPCGTGAQCVFSGWNDSGAASHTITVGSVPVAYTATFQTQYQLTVTASQGGVVTPASGGYYPVGTAVPITATAAPGYSFSSWSGGVVNPSSASTSVVIIGAQTVTANFSSLNTSAAQPISMSPSSGSSGRQLFTFVARDGSGVNGIRYTQVLFTKSGMSASNACYVSYDPAGNVFYLLSDDTTQWFGLAGGSVNTIGNAQCTIHGATSGSIKSGTDLTTTIDVSFRTGFGGQKTVYQYSGDTLGNGSGWRSMGTWNDTGDASAVELISMTPNSGAGTSQTFSAVVRDGDGANTISFAQLVMNAGLSGINACFIHYDRASNVFFLLNDAGTGWFGLIGGSPAQVNNSQCTLHGVVSSGTVAGSDLIITYTLTFSANFAGTKKIYMQAVDNAGLIEVWHQVGTWTR